MAAVFESYWHNPDFLTFDAEEFARRTRTERPETAFMSPLDVRLEPVQERLLEQIALARQRGRQRGRQRNLLVSATGTAMAVCLFSGSLPLQKL
jgi:hypothetical protein